MIETANDRNEGRNRKLNNHSCRLQYPTFNNEQNDKENYQQGNRLLNNTINQVNLKDI